MKLRYSSSGYLFIALLAILGSSCKKVLNQEPKNSTYAEVFWQNERDCQSALAGNYSLLRDAITDKNNRYYLYGDAIAKNYYTIQYTGDGLEGIQNGDFTFQYNVTSLGNWTKYYKSIAMSNIILSRIPNVPDANLTEGDPTVFKNSMLGQAYFLRALSYFMMVRVWGDVPVVTEAYEDPITAPQLPRSPALEVMKQIEDDCKKAAALLDWGYENSGDAFVTANRGSVYALLAHLYMWRGTMADLSSNTPNMVDINSADTAITNIISKGGYKLTDTTNYYNTFIGRSGEGIFEINMSENTLEGSTSGIGMEFLREDRVPYFGNNPRNYVAPGYFDYHYGADVGDLRFRKNFDYVNLDHPVCIKYSNVVFRNAGQKLDGYLSNNMIIFRLSDMMLLKAEIALYKNDPDAAIDIINSFRERNGASPDNMLDHGMAPDDVMWEYILERGKEMYLEGHIFYDLLRTRFYKYMIDWLPDDEVRFKKGGFYFPVDPRLFKDNFLLKQTTYWVGKV